MRSQINKLVDRFGIKIQITNFGRSEHLLFELSSDHLIEVATWLRMEESFRMDFLESLTIFESREHYYFTYFLRSLTYHSQVVLRTNVPEPANVKEISIASVIGIWPHAEPFESELAPLFGVNFTGAVGTRTVRKEFGNFEGYPLRKSFEWGERFVP